MTLNEIRDAIHQLSELTNEWTEDVSVPAIERDIALEKLRQLYDAIRFEKHAAPADDSTIAIPTSKIPTPPVQPVEDVAEDEIAALPENFDLSGMLDLEPENMEPEEEVPSEIADEEPEQIAEGAQEAEENKEKEPEIENEPEVEETPAAEEEPAHPTVATLFGPAESEETARHRHKQRVILSLYGVTPEPKAEPEQRAETTETESVASKEPIIEEEITEEVPISFDEEPTVTVPIAEPEDQEEKTELLQPETPAEQEAERSGQASILGEVIAPHVQTLGDSFTAEPHATISTQTEAGKDLHQLIGLNDKFLMIGDLFNNDEELFEKTINRINEFDNLDDCIIYLTENFTWNPNSDGVQLLVELLERKFA